MLLVFLFILLFQDHGTKKIKYLEENQKNLKNKLLNQESSQNLPIVSFNKDQICAKIPSGFLNISDGSNYTKQNIYACHLQFKEHILITSGILHIYNCQFTYFHNKPALQIEPDGCSTDGSIEIIRCDFLRCHEGAVYIKSKPSTRIVKISESTFTLCSRFGITFKTNYGLIEKCHFLNTYEFNGNDIFYDHELSEGPSFDLKLTITNCLFERKYSLNKGGAFIKFTEKAKFDLINNNFTYHESLFAFRLFDWPSQLTDISGFTFEDNILFPYQESALSNVKALSIDMFKERSIKCPPENESPETFLCTSYDKESDGPINSYFIIGVYHCIFHRISNTNDKLGGAIFISTRKIIISSDTTSPIKIYHSDFCHCKCSNGGAIYLESSETSRLFDVKNCFFSSNSYGKYNEKDISKGGSIFINSGLASYQISDCLFEYNSCGEGAAIYFISNTTHASLMHSKSDEYDFALKIVECKFSYNRGFTNGGAIFITICNDELVKPIEISQCIFVDNRADEKDYQDADLPENGGAIYYADDSISKEEVVSDAFRIIECSFVANIVSYFGGAIYILINSDDSTKTVEIINTKFHRNTAKFEAYSSVHPSGYGGSIYYLFNSTSSETRKLSIKENENRQDTLLISNCEFTSNLAKFDAGCIFVSVQSGDPSGNIEIKSSLFKGNTAENAASLYYEYESTESRSHSNENAYSLHVVDCTFEDNKASSNGGAIILSVKEGQPSKSIELSHCSFKNCTSTKGGGALYINISKKVSKPLFIRSLTVTECDAPFGGGFYIFSSNEETEINVVSCSFIRNKANKTSEDKSQFFGGSALYVQAANAHINDCFLSKNKNNQIKVVNNFDNSLLLSSDSSISIQNCVFEANELSNSSSLLFVRGNKSEVPSEVKNCIFKGKNAEKMNYIDGPKLSKLKIESCKFEFNTKSEMNSIVIKNRKFDKWNFMKVMTVFICVVCAISFLIAIQKKLKKSANIISDDKVEL